jgi:hypothetical protein
MNAYETMQAIKKRRLAERAESCRAQADAEYRKADLREEVSGIPLGQPILVGHHSEGKHRRAIERAERAMRKSIELAKHAEELERRANTVSHAVSSDDPDAVKKLSDNIAKAETVHALMKQANVLVRKGDVEGLGVLLGADRAAELMKPSNFGGPGFPSFTLSNSSANISRMKKRLEVLKRAADRPEADDIIIDGCTIKQNKDENRIQFMFDGKPSEGVREIMKSNGFRWAPSHGAWQRMLNNSGIYAARRAIAAIKSASASETTPSE